MDKKRIALCVHVFEDVHFDVYFNHLWCIAAWAQKYDLVMVGKSGLGAATARNLMIERCFENDCSHVLFLDGDHFIPAETLDFLMETGHEAMVSGLVCKKGEGFTQVCWDIKDEGDNRQFLQLELPLDGKVYEVGICAFGCTLINVEKLKKLKKPYFRDTCEKVADGSITNVRSDVNLCLMFGDIGERCWVDTRVLVGHRGVTSIIYPQSAQLFEKLKSIELDGMKLDAGQHGIFYSRELL